MDPTINDEVKTLVIDSGSYTFKAGFAGEEYPKHIIPSVIGIQRETAVSPIDGMCHYDTFVGYRALGMEPVVKLRSPFDHGIITNWDDFEKIMHYTFYTMFGVDPSKHPLLITEHPLTPRDQREELIKVLFETFNVPCLFFGNQSVLSLYASGRNTGVVLDAGESVTSITPIYEGYSFPHTTTKNCITGRDINYYLHRILYPLGLTSMSSTGEEIVCRIKEKHAYVAYDFNEEMNKAATTYQCQVDYKLPDGNVITINNELFKCAEILFDPKIIECNFDGIHTELFNYIMLCDKDIRKDLFANIVLSGGTSLLKGFPERFEKEIVKLAPSMTEINVVTPPKRNYTAWFGGSILASHPAFPQMVITRNDYNEAGPPIVRYMYL